MICFPSGPQQRAMVVCTAVALKELLVSWKATCFAFDSEEYHPCDSLQQEDGITMMNVPFLRFAGEHETFIFNSELARFLSSACRTCVLPACISNNASQTCQIPACGLFLCRNISLLCDCHFQTTDILLLLPDCRICFFPFSLKSIRMNM